MDKEKIEEVTLTEEQMQMLGDKLPIEQPKRYPLNINKVKTVKDIKLILEGMQLQFTEGDPEYFEKVKHLLYTED